MKLKTLEIQNFISTGNKKQTIVFKPGITVFQGLNGTGKSTFMEALYFSFFGEAYSKKTLPMLVNWINNKDAKITQTLEHNNDEYTIIRTLKPDNQILLKNGEEQAKTGTDEFNETVSKLINLDKKVANQTVFMSKEFYEPFLNLTPERKRDFLKRIFELEKYDKMKEIAKTDLQKFEQNLSNLQTNLKISLSKLEFMKKKQQEEYEENLKQKDSLQKEIEEMTSYIQTSSKHLSNELQTLQTQETELNNTIQLKTQQSTALKEKLIQLTQVQKNIEEKKTKIEIFKKQIQTNNLEIQRISETLLKLQIEIAQQKENSLKIWETERTKLKLSYETVLNQNTSNITAILENIKKLEQQKTEIENTFKNNNFKPIEEQNSQLNQLVTKILILKEKQIQDLRKKNYYEQTDHCETCGSNLTEKFRKDHIKSIEESIKQIQEQLTQLEHEETSLKSSISTIKNYEQSLLQITKELQQLSTQKQQHEYYLELNETKLKSLESATYKEPHEISIKQTTIDKALQNQRTIEIQNNYNTEQINQLTQEITNNNTEELQTIQIEYNELASILTTLANEQITLFNSKQIIQHQQSELSKYEYELKSKQEQLTTINNKLSQQTNKDIEHEEAIYNTLQTDISKLIDKIAFINDIITMLSDNGIKKYIVSKYIPFLNQIAHKYSELINSRFTVAFHQDGMKADILYRGKKVAYGQLSSGQQQRISLVVMFSFIEFLMIKNSTTFPMVFFDELLDGSLDEEGIESLILILRDLKQRIPYINIITHNTNNLNFADRIIKVTLEQDKFTKYETIEGESND